MRRLHINTQVNKLNPVLVKIAEHYGLKTVGSLDDFIARLPSPSTRVYYRITTPYDGCVAFKCARRTQLQKLLAEC